MVDTSTCYGILVDVSGSMQEALTDEFKLNDQDKSRAHAVFDTVFKTIKEERDNEQKNDNDHPKEYFFALAFGLRDTEHPHCDLFGLFDNLLSSYVTRAKCIEILREYDINHNQEQHIKTERKYNIERCTITGYEPLIQMAKRNGAPYAGEYIKKHLTPQEAGEIFMQFHHQQRLIRVTVDELPAACKEEAAHVALQAGNSRWTSVGASIALGVVTGGWGLLAAPAIIGGQQISRNEEDKAAQKALGKAKERILAPLYRIVRKPRSHEEAIDIIDRLGDAYPLESAEDATNVNVDEILNDIKPRIFGRTPMCKSLQYTQQIFQLNARNNARKRVLIISDGLSTDGDPLHDANALRNNDVIIACCFITKENIPHPTRLYDQKDGNWSKGAQKMFDMASFISNSDSSLSLLLKHGWDLAPSGESKLFIQANHPEVITQFCGIINHVAHYNDAIMDMVGHYNFDQYINNTISDKEAPQQVGGTCYANATATVLHLAMLRIHGRDGGYPDFNRLRQAMIHKHGTKGAVTERVIGDFCQQNRLRYRKVIGEENIRNVISRRRPLVSRFALSKSGWDNFSSFFQNNPNGILTRNDITKDSGRTYFRIFNENMKTYEDAQCRIESKQKFQSGQILHGSFTYEKKVKLPKQYGTDRALYCRTDDIHEVDGHEYSGGGHAVVLIRCKPNCLIFMNSWGTSWADKGFFRLEDVNVLGFKHDKMEFFDVCWTVNDLSANEIEKYRIYCKEKLKHVMDDMVPSAAYGLKYKCPHCRRMSKIKEYSGDFLKAICPKCRVSFKPKGIELVRSLYDRQI